MRLPGARRRGEGRAQGSTVKVASVATGFPSGQTFRDIKIAETRAAVEAGADEVDMVIDRGAFLSGDYLTVFEEIVEVKEAAGEAHLKVILETGELETYDNVRRASRPGHGRRRRLHQDLDRQGHAGGDAARSRWSCSRRSATSSARPGARSG